MERKRVAAEVLVLATVAGLAGSTMAGDRAVQHDFTEPTSRPPVTTGYIMIQFQSPPVASYEGGIGALEATRPERGTLNLGTPAVQAYVLDLQRQHALYRQWLAGRDPRAEVVREYSVVFNGIAVRLNGASAEEIGAGPGARAWAFTTLYRPSTSGTPGVTDTPSVSRRWDGRLGAGAGVKVGIIDSGVDDTHPFLACKRSIPHKVYATPGTSSRSDAVILDHGTAVAGVVAGCVTRDPVLGAISGVAPGAELWDYTVFPGSAADGSAFGHDVVAALEDAVLDGMDVVNLSLEGWAQEPDFLAEAVNSAVDAGIVVTVAAGNLGPGDSTVGSPGNAEKALTVGATTSGRVLGVPFTVTGRDGTRSYVGAAGDFDPFRVHPASGQSLVAWTSTGDDAATACAEASDPAPVAGAIVLIRGGTCSFTTKIRNAQSAGAAGAVVYGNVAEPQVSMTHDGSDPLPTIPAIMVSDVDGAKILASLPASGRSEGAALRTFGTTADVVAHYSARGPSPFRHLIKPDLTAPGLNVYSSALDGRFATLQGTSLAASHVAGVAAGLRQRHPEWSPLDVRSALVNTAARVVTSDGVTPASLLATGGGRADAQAAARTPLTVNPASASFGLRTRGQALSDSRDLVLRNVSGEDLSCTVTTTGPGLVRPSETSIALVANEQATLRLDLEAAASASGDHDGDLEIVCGETTLRVPWWVRIDPEAPSPPEPRPEAPPACADLVITGFTISPVLPVVGLNALIDVTVLNQGTCASLSFVVQWRSSIVAPNGPTTFVPGLAAGAARTVSFQYAFPNAGNFTTVAVADSDNTVSEFNESNNLAIRSVTVLPERVDLQIADFKVEPAPGVPASIPPLPVAGRLTRATITVKNQSNVPVGDFWLQWKPTLLAPPLSRQVNGLGPGGSAALTFDYTYPAAGQFTSLATVDPTGKVQEANELNNTQTLPVVVERQLPDLEITALTISPAQPVRGISATATLMVRNRGNTPTGTFILKWTPRPGVAALARQINGLDANQSTSVTFDHTYTVVGTFNSEAVVDSTGTTAELDEGNNSRTLVVTVVPDTIDLEITAMTIRSGSPGKACEAQLNLIEPELVQGANVNICITVTNHGNAPAGPFLVEWNPDTFNLITPSPSTLSRQIDSLGAGQSVDVPFDFVYHQFGNFRTVAKVDAFNSVAESNEANNLRIVNVVVRPAPIDLVITSFTISPTSPIRGSKATASITVRNLGTYPTGSFYVQWKPTGKDAGTGKLALVQGLNAFGQPNDSLTVQLDAAFFVAGPYTSWAMVDAFNQVIETNELNNEATLNVNVQPRMTTLRVRFDRFFVIDDLDGTLSGEGEWQMVFAVLDPNAKGQCQFSILGQGVDEDGLICMRRDYSTDSGHSEPVNESIQVTLIESFPVLFAVAGIEDDSPLPPDIPGAAVQFFQAADYRGVGTRTVPGQQCDDRDDGRCFDLTFTIEIVSEPPPLFSGAELEGAPPSQVASEATDYVLPRGISQLIPPDAVLPAGVVRGRAAYLPGMWRTPKPRD
jgi:minor extracellular serine protease Vpr